MCCVAMSCVELVQVLIPRSRISRTILIRCGAVQCVLEWKRFCWNLFMLRTSTAMEFLATIFAMDRNGFHKKAMLVTLNTTHIVVVY